MRVAAALLVAALVASCAPAWRGGIGSEPSPTMEAPEGHDTLPAVRARGHLRCGTDDSGFWSPSGVGGGFATDLCRVIAAAVIGQADAVERIPVSDAVATLSAGEADVVVPGMVWTASRDGAGQVAFTTPVFFGGVGVMAPPGQAGDLAALADAVVCVAEGALTARAAQRLRGLGAVAMPFADPRSVEAAFRARACDAWADDVKRLAAARRNLGGDPDELAVVDGQLTLQPIAPAVADGDAAWRDAVNWAVLATFLAEEAGLDAAGVAERVGTDDPDVRRLFGLRTLEPGEDRPVRVNPGLGLPADFPAQVVGQVGNYAEIHARHLGVLGIPRGPTALWRDGGLVYPPPLR